MGGDFNATVVKSMKQFGRVAIVGGISEYNNSEEKKGSLLNQAISYQYWLKSSRK